MRSWLALNAQRFEIQLRIEEIMEEMSVTAEQIQQAVDVLKERAGWPQCDCSGCNEARNVSRSR